MAERDTAVDLADLRGAFAGLRDLNHEQHERFIRDINRANATNNVQEKRLTAVEKAVVEIGNKLERENAASARPWLWLERVGLAAAVILSLGSVIAMHLTKPTSEEMKANIEAALTAHEQAAKSQMRIP